MADAKMVGDDCSTCGMGYDECTKRILEQRRPACCGKCGRTDTHNERAVVPFSSADEGKSFPDRAKELVSSVTHGTVYVVWFAYVLGAWKALCSTDLPDGRYYEVTSKADGTVFLDTYEKISNTEMKP